MQNQINLAYYKGFKWIHTERVSFIGYLLNGKNLIPSAEDISEIFKDCYDVNSFKKVINKLNGVFSIVCKTKDEVFVASDPTRYFTIFYTVKDNSELIISDDIYSIADGIKAEVSELSKLEFLSAGFTCGNRTLYEDIYQVQSGEMISFTKNGIDSEFYFSFSAQQNEIETYDLAAAVKRISSKLDQSFSHSLGLLKDHPILLPLSGGYDSRLIAVILKELGFKNVICFTYGRPTQEVNISKQVAGNLGFDWYFIEYTDELIKDFHSDPVFNDYFQYASRACSMFFLQEYPAIKYLLEQKIITAQFVAIPGHSGDLLRGAMINKHFKETISANSFCSYLLNKKFYHHPLKSHEKIELRELLTSDFRRIRECTSPLPYTITEDWELRERTSKYIFNSAHAFTFFGIKTFFPFADRELMDFFRRLPYKARIHGNAYYSSLQKYFLKKYHVDFKNDIQPTKKDFALSEIKRIIRQLLPASFRKKLLEKNDWPFYGPMTKYLLDELHFNNVYPKTNYSSYLYRILHWYVMRLVQRKHSPMDL